MVDSLTVASTINSVANQIDISDLPGRITQAIKNAAARTGVDFSYLMKKASQESGFDPNAKASSSSATGLFQFTSQTWLQMIKQHGADYNLGNYADHIQIDSNGIAHVSDPVWKQAILALRQDPQISANMAGELDKTNMASLQDNVGGKISATDLYMAHFLGAGGASDFLNAMKSNPNARAADVLPDAATANPSVFYTNTGTARSLSQIYQHFAQKFEGGSATTLVASAPSATQVSAQQIAANTAASATNRVLSSALAYKTAHASYQLASMADVQSTSLPSTPAAASTSSYVLPVTSNIKISPSSMTATMILAGMNVGDFGNLTGLNATTINPRNKNNALSTLSGVA